MTAPAVGRRIRKHAIHVTARTVRTHVRTRQSKRGRPVIERRRLPTHIGMTRRAVLRKGSRHVVRVLHILVVCAVTAPTVGRRIRKHAIHVTPCTIRAHVGARQGKRGRTVIKRRGLPTPVGMTRCTILRKGSRHVVRILHILVVRSMAAPAV